MRNFLLRYALAAAILPLFPTGCATPEVASAGPPSPNIDAAVLPPKGITLVRDVNVSDQGGDKLELVAFAEPHYKMQEVMAVLWCRARDEAIRRKYDGWYAVSFRQAFSGTGNHRQAGIGVVQMFRGAPPPGKQRLKEMKNWCLEAPAAARNA